MIAQIVQKLIAPIGQGTVGQGTGEQGAVGQGFAGQGMGDEVSPSGDGDGQFAGLMAEGGDTPPDEFTELVAATESPALMGPEFAQPVAGAMALVWAGGIDAATLGGDLGDNFVASGNMALGHTALLRDAAGISVPFALGPDMAGDGLAQQGLDGQDLTLPEGGKEQPSAIPKAGGASLTATLGAERLAGSALPYGGTDMQAPSQQGAGLGQGLALAGLDMPALGMQGQNARPELALPAMGKIGLADGLDAGDISVQSKGASPAQPIAGNLIAANTNAVQATVAPPVLAGTMPAAMAAAIGQGAMADGPRKDRLQPMDGNAAAPTAQAAPSITPPAAQLAGGQMGAVMVQPAAQWWTTDQTAQFGLGEGLGGSLAIGEVGLRPQGGAGPAGPAFGTPMPSLPIAGQLLPYAGAAQSGLVEVTLSPAELGQLKFEILHRGEGVQIVLSAERGDTLDLLRRNSDQLLADFRNAGFSGASLSFGGWGAGQGQNARPVAGEVSAQEATDSAQTLAQSAAAFARARPMLDTSRSLNLRL